MALPQQVPSETSVGGNVARRLAILLGPAWQPADGSNFAADLLALGGGLGGSKATWNGSALTVGSSQSGRASLLASLAEAFPDTTVQCIAEWEAMIAAPNGAGLLLAARQAALLAWYQTRFGGDPRDLLTAVQALAPEATLTENSAASVASTNPRWVYVFAVVLSSAHAESSTFTARVAAVVDVMKPAHAGYVITNAVGFLTDDNTTPSWTDLTVLNT